MEGGEASGAIAIGATSPYRWALGGEELGSEEIGAVFCGLGTSADHREMNSSLEPPLPMVVWPKSLNRDMNSSLEPPLPMVVWPKSLARLSPLEPALAMDIWLKSLGWLHQSGRSRFAHLRV
jgi:hypothetical protein